MNLIKQLDKHLTEPLPTTIEEVSERNASAHNQFKAFVSTLPKWVKAEKYMDLYLMSDAGLKVYLLNFAPKAKRTDHKKESQSPYLKNNNNKKPEKIGRIRI